MSANLEPAFEPAPFLELPVNNDTDSIVSNIVASLGSGLPLLGGQRPVRSEALAIVGGGPSLATYMPILRGYRPDIHVLAVNGAYKHLRSQGIDPDHFMMIDSRLENIAHVDTPCETTKHYLATQIHPAVIEQLYGYDVTLFNLGTAAAHKAHKQLGLKEIEHITAPIGMASVHAVYLAAALGYRTIFLFGYDFSHADSSRYAFDQPVALNPPEGSLDVEIDGKKFRTTLALARTAEQFFKSIGPLLRAPTNLDVHLYSDGLLRAVLEHQLARPTEQTEREKYEAMWKVDAYRKVSPGLAEVDAARRLLGMPIGQDADCASVADFGCGTGRSTSQFAEWGYRAVGVDIAGNALECNVPFVQAALWDADKLPKVDYGFSVDVLEHIPTEKVDDTLAAIHGACAVGCYLNIDTIPDAFGVLIGQTLHETVQPGEWWEDKLRALWPHVERIRPEDKRQAIFVCRK